MCDSIDSIARIHKTLESKRAEELVGWKKVAEAAMHLRMAHVVHGEATGPPSIF